MKVLDSSAAIELILATPRGQRVAAVFRDPAYDATFISLAEHLGATLVTADARLSNAPGSSAEVVLIR